jgi:hypothetical protein
MGVTRWSLMVLTLAAGCGKPSSPPGGVLDFTVGLIGEHGPKVSLRLDVPKGWQVRPDPYAAVVAAPGASEFEPTVSATASRCSSIRGADLELRPATGAECLQQSAGYPGDQLAFRGVSLTPDQGVLITCVVRGAGAIATQGRAVCEGLVAQDPR